MKRLDTLVSIDLGIPDRLYRDFLIIPLNGENEEEISIMKRNFERALSKRGYSISWNRESKRIIGYCK